MALSSNPRLVAMIEEKLDQKHLTWDGRPCSEEFLKEILALLKRLRSHEPVANSVANTTEISDGTYGEEA